jgi:hypothetical protein
MRGFGRTKRPILFFLKEAQKFGLRLQWQAVDLVQQQRAAVRFPNQSGFSRCGAGESARFVTEEFVFDQFVRDRAAIDGDEGKPCAWAEIMNRARAQLLSRAGLTQDQDAGIGLRHDGNLLDLLQEGRALSDQLLQTQPLFQRPLQMVFPLRILQQPPDARVDVERPER